MATWSSRKGKEGIREMGRPRRQGMDSHGKGWTFLSNAKRICSGPWAGVRVGFEVASISVRTVTMSTPICVISATLTSIVVIKLDLPDRGLARR